MFENVNGKVVTSLSLFLNFPRAKFIQGSQYRDRFAYTSFQLVWEEKRILGIIKDAIKTTHT